MSNYRIFETAEYLKRLKKLDPSVCSLIEQKVSSYVYPQLREQPFFGLYIKKLAGYVPETWRYRIGKFRLFYGIDVQNKIINILTVEFRKDAY